MKMRKKVIGLCLAGALVLSACGNKDTADKNQGDNVKDAIITVNGSSISKADFDSQVDLYAKMLASQYGIDENIKESMIQELILKQDLEKNGMKLTDEDLKKAKEDTIAQYGGEEEYKKALATLNITEEQMDKTIDYTATSKKHMAWYKEKNAPSEEKQKEHYENNKEQYTSYEISHILVEKEEEANDVLKRLEDGEKFEDLAKELSQDPGSAQNGGKLGAQPMAYLEQTYDPDFVAALKELKEGERSKAVKSQFGYHIISLDKINDSFEDVQTNVINDLLSKDYQAYLENLRKEAKVEEVGKEEESKQENTDQESAKDQGSEESK